MKKLLYSLILFLFYTTVHATYAHSRNDLKEDYGSNFYEDEGRLTFKVKGGYMVIDGTQNGLPEITLDSQKNNPAKTDTLLDNAFYAEASTTLFLHDIIGLEISVGAQRFSIIDDTIKNIGTNYYAQTKRTQTETFNLYGVPVSLIGQLHMAPFGGIRPYVGIGGHFTYMMTKSSEFTTKNLTGLIAQVGIDFIARDDAIITLEAKKYFLTETEISYSNQDLLGNQNIKATIDMNAFIVSLGMGMRF